MKPIDIHTHISAEDFDVDREAVLSRALEACDALIDIGAGTSNDAFEKARLLSEKNEKVFFTAGVHPHDADKIGSDPEILSAIEKHSSHPRCVAVGECGLDYYYENSKPESQKKVFQWHIDLATRTNLPLMIHTRDAEADTMSQLAPYTGGAVFHCFTGTQELANFGIQKGFFVSFSGIVTFKNAEPLRQVFLKTPLQNVLIETDAPFLAPVPMRGKRNETSFVVHTAKFLADLRKMPLEDFFQITHENSLRAFPKMKLRAP